MVPGFVLAHFFHHLLGALVPPLLPLIRDEFALDYTQAGLVISALTLSTGIGQLSGGWLGDRISPRILITVGISGVALAGLLVGLSQTYVMLIIFLALMGLVSGGYHPSAPPIISASVKPAKRGQALGFHLIGGGLSYFVAPLAGAGIASAWGWRGSFVGLAVPTFLFGLVFYMLLGRQAAVKKEEHKILDTGDEIPQPENQRRRLIVVIVLSAFIGSMLLSTTYFVTLFLVDRFGVSKETAAASLSLLFSCGIWVTPLGGYLSDRVGRVPVLLWGCLATGPMVYLLNASSYGLGLGAALIGVGATMYLRMPVAEAYIISHTTRRHRSIILGIYYFGGQEGSAVLTPLLGYLIDHFGFYTSFNIVAATLVTVTLIGSVFLWGGRD